MTFKSFSYCRLKSTIYHFIQFVGCTDCDVLKLTFKDCAAFRSLAEMLELHTLYAIKNVVNIYITEAEFSS